MNLISEVRRILEKNNYSVARAGERDDIVHFEDGNVMGFVWAATTVNKLLTEWEDRQDSFLKLNSEALRRSDLKAWNLYAVLLTTDQPNEEERVALAEIEENFRAARKIARGGLSTSGDVLNALLPVTPIQTTVSVEREDELARLRQRVKSLPSPVAEILLKAEEYSQKGVDGILRAYADKRNKD
jgi:hypothetical protein